ncbi:hypothetical protein [Streptomyces fagopyri]|uniref:hypothetical protein n=1 Tax=Streptomyces fagopyri TaxID=2662397 RepID=UPI0037152294
MPEIVEVDVTETGRGEGAEPDPPEVVPSQDTAAGPDEDEPGPAGLRCSSRPATSNNLKAPEGILTAKERYGVSVIKESAATLSMGTPVVVSCAQSTMIARQTRLRKLASAQSRSKGGDSPSCTAPLR